MGVPKREFIFSRRCWGGSSMDFCSVSLCFPLLLYVTNVDKGYSMSDITFNSFRVILFQFFFWQGKEFM